MGAVYLARDRSLGRPVALKVLLGSLARNRDQVRRFLREAKAAAPLVHPNIVRIYEAGVRDGVPYIAMEYVEGEPLDRFLARTGALDWHHALHIAQQVAQALDCAHAAGVVHRDVKPANILLDAHGRVRLTDFGIARILDPQGSGFTTHECLGTPEYMSPELCAGEKVGPPADLFSLGVTLFYMLSGRMPFHGDSHVALVQSITNEEAPRLNRIMIGVPDDVARLTAHLLEKDPTARPESAAAVVAQFDRLQRENGGASALPEALRAFVQEEAQPRKLKSDTPVPGKSRPKRVPKVKRRARKHRYTAISSTAQAAVAAMVAVAIAGLGYWQAVRPEPLPPAAPALAASAVAGNTQEAPAFAMPARQWRVGRLAWTPDAEALLVVVEGRPGSTAQGTRGVLAFHPATGEVQSVVAPTPLHSAASPVMTPASFHMTHDGAFAVPAVARPEGSAGVTLLAQRWDEAHPRTAVLARFTPRSWHATARDPWSTPSAGTAVLRPDGEGACALLFDPATGGNYIAEIALDQRRGGAAPQRLTSPGSAILAESIRYTPDGSHIAYMREKSGSERELWLVASRGRERDGQPIAIGRLDNAMAFSPDSAHVVVGLQGTRETELVLVETARGEILARLGAGTIEDGAYHPSGNYLLARAQDDESGRQQIWAVESVAPYRRQRVSQFSDGALHAAAVSPDGRWAATTRDSASGEEVTLIDLTRLFFGG